MQASSPAPITVPALHRAVREMAYHALLACEAIDMLTAHRPPARSAHAARRATPLAAPAARA